MLSPPLSFTWGDLVDRIVDERGSLAEVVRALYELHPDALPEDPATAERGLRRLRSRGARPGDKYGRLLLRAFGLPPGVAAWARALGLYHGPLIDLPMPLRREQLRLWDRAPVLESAHGAWIHLALASLRHQDGQPEEADRRLELAALGARRAGPEAELELLLFQARRLSDRGEDEGPILAACAPLLARVDDPCFQARWLDQRAYSVSRAWREDPSSLERALALRAQIPERGPPFVVYRRHHGLAWVLWRMGRTDEAAEHAQVAVEVAGDGGLLRLRAAALRLLGRVQPLRRAALEGRAEAILRRVDG